MQWKLRSNRWSHYGSPLGPVLAGIFMVELENTLVTTLSNHLMSWKRYVNDTNCFLKEDSIEHVMSVLNGFHPSIQFTYETESNNRLSFLDILIIRNGQSIETCSQETYKHRHLYSLKCLCFNPVETQHSKNFILSFIFNMFKWSLPDIRNELFTESFWGIQQLSTLNDHTSF